MVRGNIVFMMLLKTNCDLILIKSINSNSHSLPYRRCTRKRPAPACCQGAVLRGPMVGGGMSIMGWPRGAAPVNGGSCHRGKRGAYFLMF